ncbi:GTP-binding protein [Microbacterium amylolyticum]|uniref:G3E family GTPase n=1 Tax=Microbacterium amylolyticum TaxID=936337 RepID=A0ABS4ZL71_9MICO|nr:GTP-binding protein [Microbacterium amylolyticum]MBP2437700.1 G3E family GTPase [Microbacterium amylolyticum]
MPRGFESLVVEQCLFASQILLTKVDKLTEVELLRVAAAVSDINPSVAIDGIHYGHMAFERIAAMPEYDYHRVEVLSRELEAMDDERGTQDGIASLVIDDPRPLHPARLHRLFTTALPQQCYRSKGFFWLPSRDDRVLAWSQAAGQIGLEAIGYWKAGVLGEARPNRAQRRAAQKAGDRIVAGGGRLTQLEREVLVERMKDLDPRFGDRRTQLTLIGERAETELFRDLLMDCFCTEQEILRWQKGGSFDDPWPTATLELQATE